MMTSSRLIRWGFVPFWLTSLLLACLFSDLPSHSAAVRTLHFLGIYGLFAIGSVLLRQQARRTGWWLLIVAVSGLTSAALTCYILHDKALSWMLVMALSTLAYLCGLMVSLVLVGCGRHR